MQKPSPGRIVLAIVDPLGNNGTDVCPAVITRVWNDSMVNVKTVKDGNVDEWLTSVILCQDEDDARASGSPRVAFWPPRV